MLGLLEALSALGVPDVALVDELEAYGDDLLATVDPADLNNAETVTRAAAQNAPEFVALAEAAARAFGLSNGLCSQLKRNVDNHAAIGLRN